MVINKIFYRQNYQFQLLLYFCVFEPEEFYAFIFQIFLSFQIMFQNLSVVVNFSVYLYYQFQGMAIKISNIDADRMLPPEFMSERFLS